MPPEVFDGAILPTEGHTGWTRGSYEVTHDGAAIYELPLQVPAGRAGMEPDLALVYRSGAPNGHLGVGWSIRGLSSIARCGRTIGIDGVTDGVRWDGEEFCLDGVRLIAEGDKIYPDGGDLRAIHGGFSRIDRDGEPTNPTSFRVWDRDGRIRTYGTDTAVVSGRTVAAGPDGALGRQGEVTYAWLLRRIEDRAGNAIDYEYERPQHGADRDHAVELRISKITYTSHPDFGPGRRHVEFEYGDRRDPVLGFVRGLPLATTGRIQRIVMSAPAPRTGATQSVREYNLDYDTCTSSTGRTLLCAVRECDGSRVVPTPENPNPVPPVCRQAVAFEWTQNELSLEETDTGLVVGAGETLPREIVTVGDFTGDGRDDLILRSYPQYSIGVNRPSGWFAVPMSGLGTAPRDPSFIAFDHDGHGRSAFFEIRSAHPVYDSGWAPDPDETTAEYRPRVRLWEADYTPVLPPGGVPLVLQGHQASLCSGPHSGAVMALGDFDGDGVSDRLGGCLRERAWVFGLYRHLPDDAYGAYGYSGGGSFEITHRTIDVPEGEYVEHDREAHSAAYRIIEMDGDGRADFVYPGFEGESWWRQSLAAGATRFGDRAGVNIESADEHVFLDVNGDGLTDVLTFRDPEHGFVVRLNTGNGFGPPRPGLRDGEVRREWRLHDDDLPGRSFPGDWLHMLAQEYEYAADVFVADFDRDGRQDFALRIAPPPGPWADRVDGLALLHLSDGAQFRTVEAGSPGDVRRLSGNGFLFDEVTIDGEYPVDGGASRASGGWPASGAIDADGDGFLDYLVGQHTYRADGAPTGQIQLSTRRLIVGTADLLRTVRVGGNEQVRFEWSASGRADVVPHQIDTSGPIEVGTPENPLPPRDTGRCEYPLLCSTGPFQVVSAHVDARGVRYSHAYHGPRTDLRGWGWVGYERHVVAEQVTGTVTEWTFDRDAYTRMSGYWRTDPVRVRRFVTDPDSGRLHLHEELVDYQSRTLSDLHAVTLPRRHETRDYEADGCPLALPIDPERLPQAVLTCVAAGAKDVNLIRSQVTEYDYDRYGTLRWVESTNPDVGVTRTTVTIADRLESHLIGLRERVEVESETPEGTRSVRTTAYAYDSRGLLDFVDVEPDRPQYRTRTDVEIDALGLVREVTLDAQRDPRTTKFDYDGERIFVSHVTNALGHETVHAVHPGLGVTVAEMDSNGVITRHRYDGLGRTRETELAELVDRVAYVRDPQGLEVRTESASGIVARRVLHWTGRVAAERWVTSDEGWSRRDVSYDALGRVERVTAPYFESPGARPTQLTHYSYDALGRPTVVSTHEGETYVSYVGRRVMVKNPRGHTTTRVMDMGGRIVESFAEAASSTGRATTIRYEYGPFGVLERRYDLDHPTRPWEYQYDDVGQLVWQSDPDAGVRRYAYSPLGERVAELDPVSGEEIHSWKFDLLGRLEGEWDVKDGDVTYEWDLERIGQLGRATRVEDRVSEVYKYDELGRSNGLVTEIDGRAYEVGWTFDSRGRVDTLRYPGETLVLQHKYNPSTGQLEHILDQDRSIIWRATRRDAAARVTELEYGNGIATTRKYDEQTGRLRGIFSSGHRADVQALELDYDSVGNLRSRIDGILGDDFGFAYDLEDRLEVVTAGGDEVSRFEYDAGGNLLRMGPESFHRRGVHRYSGATYDGRGRVEQIKFGAEFEWTHFDLPRVVRLPGASETHYRYTASGARAQQARGDEVTDYVAGLFESRSVSGGRIDVARIYAGGELVAERHFSPYYSAPIAHYLHTDQIGNVDVVTNEKGDVVERYRYQPFGARERLDADGVPTGGAHTILAGFTGHEHDETGFINARGRLYDPSTGRFLTPDPIIRDPFHRQSLNAYSYVENRPLTWTDPSGLIARPSPSGSSVQEASGLFGWFLSAAAAVFGDTGSLSSGHGDGLDGAAGWSEHSTLSPFVAEQESARGARVTQNGPSRIVDGHGVRGALGVTGGETGSPGAAALLALPGGYGGLPGGSLIPPEHVIDFIMGVGNGFVLGHEAPDPYASAYYNVGSAVGNVARAAGGVAIAGGGIAIGTGGAAITVGSGGTLAVGGVAVVVAGVGVVAVGSTVTASGVVGAVDSVVMLMASAGGGAPPAWQPPPAATSRVPASWGAGRPTSKGIGIRWLDPDAPSANGIRIDRGNPASPFPSQRVDHVIVRRGGNVIGRDGRPISGSIRQDPVNAHIPLSDWLGWSSWYAP